MNIDQIQEEIYEWQRTNFPTADSTQMLIGIQEELGELSHHHLKELQQIRMDEDHHEDQIDAIGDILIFMFGYCSKENINLLNALQVTWDKVKQRDYNNHRKTGAQLDNTVHTIFLCPDCGTTCPIIVVRAVKDDGTPICDSCFSKYMDPA